MSAHHETLARDPGLTRALRVEVSVAGLVRDLARTHDISASTGALDAFAASASRLSDAEVRPDEIEDLLVALTREGVITPADSMALHAVHLRQTAG